MSKIYEINLILKNQKLTAYAYNDNEVVLATAQKEKDDEVFTNVYEVNIQPEHFATLGKVLNDNFPNNPDFCKHLTLLAGEYELVK